jgi:hypothetical protein
LLLTLPEQIRLCRGNLIYVADRRLDDLNESKQTTITNDKITDCPLNQFTTHYQASRSKGLAEPTKESLSAKLS